MTHGDGHPEQTVGGGDVGHSGAVLTCDAIDYPVWADGSQDHIECEEPAEHAGPHVGHAGNWTWNS